MLALVAILFSLQFYLSFERMTKRYEAVLANDYSIIVSSAHPLSTPDLSMQYPIIAEVEPISADKVLESLKGDLSAENFQLLKVTMPKFYRLKLKHYPSSEELAKLEGQLKGHIGIIRVETFARSQSKIYQLLMVVNYLLLVFLVTIGAISLLLMVKQMEVWRYEHQVRMHIMEIFGAPLWLRSAVLFRLATIDSILSALLVIAIFLYLRYDPTVTDLLEYIGLGEIIFDPLIDGAALVGIALTISILAVIAVIMRKSEEL